MARLRRSPGPRRPLARDDPLDRLRSRDRTHATSSEPLHGATDDVRAALAQGNRDYEARFGYIFIICATGRPAEDILAALHERLTNDPADEIRIAAADVMPA